MAMVCKGQLCPERLPPSPRAANFHGLCAHLQIMSWKTLDQEEITFNPDDWGWKMVDDNFVPVPTDQPVAPDNLLKIVRCSCKTDCSTKRCTYIKNQPKCMSACADCSGKDCKNAVVLFCSFMIISFITQILN